MVSGYLFVSCFAVGFRGGRVQAGSIVMSQARDELAQLGRE